MTGYTHILVEKNLDFNQFVMICTRAFGHLINMRDENLDKEIPNELPLDTYYKDESEKHKQKINLLKRMSKTEAINWAKAQINYTLKGTEDTFQKNKIEQKKCQAILEQVKSWTPPTEDHLPLKTFMIDQLECSIKDNLITYYKDEIKRIKNLDPLEYYKDQIKMEEESLEHTQNYWERTLTANKKSNKWLKDLRKSLFA